MSKIKIQLLLTAILFFLYTNASWAAINSSVIVQNFIEAVQSKDKQKIAITLNDLIKNFDAQKLLQENWPDHFTLFNLYKIAEQIKNIKSNYGYGSTNTIEPSPTTPNTSKGLSSNRDYINTKTTSNRIAVRQSSPLSNIDAVRQNPNQDQESNQERIRRRR